MPRRDRSLGANGPSSNMSGSFINPNRGGRDYSLSRLGNHGNYPPMFAAGSNGPSWTDSMPRRDFYNSSGAGQTGSLPRRDKAGLGRPEPGGGVPGGVARPGNNSGAAAFNSNSSMNGGQKGAPPPTRRRESSLTRDSPNTFMPSPRDNLLNKGTCLL